MKPVLLVRNDQPDPGGVVLDGLERAGLPSRFVDAFAGEPLPSLEDTSGIVVFGGVQHADQVERHPYLMAERHLLRGAVDDGVPVLGICLGAQILAMAHDAPLRAAPVREFGYTPIKLTDAGREDPLLSVYRDGDRVFHWHEDTFDLPEEATLLMVGDDVPNQGFRMGDHAWGVQFHCEVTEDVLAGWMRAAGDEVVSSWGKSPDRIREESRSYLAAHEERAHALIARFAEVVRTRARG